MIDPSWAVYVLFPTNQNRRTYTAPLNRPISIEVRTRLFLNRPISVLKTHTALASRPFSEQQEKDVNGFFRFFQGEFLFRQIFP